jgi:hypothetical protein
MSNGFTPKRRHVCGEEGCTTQREIELHSNCTRGEAWTIWRRRRPLIASDKALRRTTVKILDISIPIQSSRSRYGFTRSLERMWSDGYRFIKAGIVLLDRHRPQALPASLFPTRDPAKSDRLMRALDMPVDRHVRGSVRVASTAPEGSWNMKRQRLTPRYTTCADEMPAVRT